MTQTLTTERLQDIYEAAVHVEATLNDPDAEFELLCKLEDVGGTSATIRKLIDLVRAANREAQPVAWRYRTTDINGNPNPRWSFSEEASLMGLYQPLYTAPPAPAVPDGYCIMPLKLTAANGAKGALSGEFKVSRMVRCHECGGEGCDDCADAG